MSVSRTDRALWAGLGLAVAIGFHGAASGQSLAPPVSFEPGAGGGAAPATASTPRGLVPRLLGELPLPPPSPAQRRLTVRLLAGGDLLAGETAARMAGLAALGAASEALALAAGVPGAFSDAQVARHWVEVQLLRTPEALDCQEVARLAAGFGWPRLTEACRAASHDGAATPPPPTPASLTAPDAADLALAQAAGLALPPEVLTLRSPLLLAAVARSEASDAELRLKAGERAAAAGTLSATELAALYAAIRFSPAALARPLSSSERGARARALVYQAALGESQPAVRAELIHRGLDVLEPSQLAGAIGAVPLGLLETLPVDAATRWLAPAAVRGFFAAGRPEAAARWLAEPAAAAEAAVLARQWPLAVLADAPPALTATLTGGPGFEGWLDAAVRGADAGRRARVAGVLTLLQAAGEPVAAEAWTRVADAGPGASAALPSPALWQAFQSAAAGHRTGELVLAALAMLGEGGPTALSPLVLGGLVAGLREAGFAAEARALAREAVAALVD
ncbi:MAG: hypothetical protein WCO00_10685 [Rhodospirillaceae bacterium]